MRYALAVPRTAVRDECAIDFPPCTNQPRAAARARLRIARRGRDVVRGLCRIPRCAARCAAQRGRLRRAANRLRRRPRGGCAPHAAGGRLVAAARMGSGVAARRRVDPESASRHGARRSAGRGRARDRGGATAQSRRHAALRIRAARAAAVALRAQPELVDPFERPPPARHQNRAAAHERRGAWFDGPNLDRAPQPGCGSVGICRARNAAWFSSIA